MIAFNPVMEKYFRLIPMEENSPHNITICKQYKCFNNMFQYNFTNNTKVLTIYFNITICKQYKSFNNVSIQQFANDAEVLTICFNITICKQCKSLTMFQYNYLQTMQKFNNVSI